MKNDSYFDVYNFMSTYIDDINEGAVWADQDLKSSNHFYSPKTKRVLYGNSNAKNECESYYNRAFNEFLIGDIGSNVLFRCCLSLGSGCDHTSACKCETS